MKRVNYRYVVLLLPLLWLMMAGGCSDTDEDSAGTPRLQDVTMAVSRTPLSAPFFVAESQGFFREAGLQATLLDIIGGNKCLQAMLDGMADMSTASDLPVMFQAAKDDNFIVAATFVHSSNDVKVIGLARSEIKKISDLPGKRVAVVPGSASHFALEFILASNSVPISDITLVDLDPDQMPAALAAGTVDAVSIWEPFGYKSSQIEDERIVILPHEKIYRETFNLAVRRDYFESNPDTVEKTLGALHKAILFMDNEPEKAQQILVERLNVDDGFIQWIWPDFQYGLRLDQELLMTLEDEAEWAMQRGLVDREEMPNYLHILEPGPLQKVAPENVTLIY